jgi:hypothetical protein
MPSQIVIKDKRTGEIVDRTEATFGTADAKAKAMLGRHGEKLKYEIVRPIN